MKRKRLSLLGSTGSIGRSALDVVARHPGRFRVEVLAANRNAKLLLEQCRRFRPAAVALADPAAARGIAPALRRLARPPRLLAGPEGLRQAAAWPAADMVLSALMGTAGLLPTLDAIRAGKDIALANKETLVTAGTAIMAEVRKHRVKLLPVDSEHAALAQCLRGHAGVPVRRLILTASGGPFRSYTQARLRRVTVAQALRHPTWSMGAKITIDSATMMNKGLEIIEAHHLFGVPFDRIEVAVHPQSIVHSLVEFIDGSTLAQLSHPDMRLPIQTALAEPERLERIVAPLDFKSGFELTFLPPDTRRFPCLALAYQAGRAGGTAPAVLNAANEAAVQAFLDHRLDFPGIPRIIKQVLARRPAPRALTLEAALAADAWARQAAEEAIACKP
ncbi:MAG: 1-deoxy-D-xylulose-5-phosphate reductoisomerase [candidate division FCPU426 bacterium]